MPLPYTLVREGSTGKSKGFGFICYEDQRSTILAVDNLNGTQLCKRTIGVDHVHTYKLPKDLEKMDQDRKTLFMEGCAPKPLPPKEIKKELKSPKKSKKEKSKRRKRSKSPKRKKHKKDRK